MIPHLSWNLGLRAEGSEAWRVSLRTPWEEERPGEEGRGGRAWSLAPTHLARLPRPRLHCLVFLNNVQRTPVSSTLEESPADPSPPPPRPALPLSLLHSGSEEVPSLMESIAATSSSGKYCPFSGAWGWGWGGSATNGLWLPLLPPHRDLSEISWELQNPFSRANLFHFTYGETEAQRSKATGRSWHSKRVADSPLRSGGVSQVLCLPVRVPPPRCPLQEQPGASHGAQTSCLAACSISPLADFGL